MVEIIELGELKTVEDATHDQCDENGIDGTSCGGKMISVPAIPNYYGRTKRHLMCQNHIHNYWGAIAWYEQENNLHRLHGKRAHIIFYDGSTESEAETFASECECGEGVEGEEYECTCCEGIFCVDCIENGDISAYTIMTGDNPVADHPRIEETETGSNFSGWGAICGECMSAIEYELDELPPIHEVMEEEQGTANFSMEGQVKKKSNLMELVFAGAIVGLLTFSAMKRN
jgi:hypothetical protein